MHRRRYLALAGGILVAGCTDGENDVEAKAADNASTADSASDAGATRNASASETKTAENRPTSEPQLSSTVAVTNHELRAKSDGSSMEVGILADVVNDGDSHSGRIHLTGQFYDDSGSMVGDAKTDMADLAPGETWRAYIPYEGNNADSITSHAIGGRVPDPLPNVNPSGLSIQQMSLDVTDTAATIHGTIANESDSTVSYVQAVGFFHQEAHTVLDSNSASTNDLGSGETWSFEIDSGMPAFRREQIASQTMVVTDSSF